MTRNQRRPAELNVCSLRVWIGDPLNGIKAEASINSHNEAWMIDGSIARWLHEAALRLYPDVR